MSQEPLGMKWVYNDVGWSSSATPPIARDRRSSGSTTTVHHSDRTPKYRRTSTWTSGWTISTRRASVSRHRGRFGFPVAGARFDVYADPAGHPFCLVRF